MRCQFGVAGGRSASAHRPFRRRLLTGTTARVNASARPTGRRAGKSDPRGADGKKAGVSGSRRRPLARLAELTDPGEETQPALTVVEPAAEEKEPCWPPKPLVRTCQATLERAKRPSRRTPYEIIRVTIDYRANNEVRMDYPRYCQAGLPICSGLVESLVKPFNRRVNGTEPFWNPRRAEAILQLRADTSAKTSGRPST